MGAYPGAMEHVPMGSVRAWTARGGSGDTTRGDVLQRRDPDRSSSLPTRVRLCDRHLHELGLAETRRGVETVRHRGRLDRPRAAAACEHVAQSLARAGGDDAQTGLADAGPLTRRQGPEALDRRAEE